MKAGWKQKTLGDICQMIGGGTPSKERPEYYCGDIPWATVRDMRTELISETECRITKEAVKNSATNIIPSGNVVIATRVGLGKVCLISQDTAINQDLRAIVPLDSKVLSVRFLFLWLKGIAHLIVAEGTGATVQGVKLPFVKSLQIPLPPLAEQKRIVTLLDEAFAHIATAKANAEQNLQNARAVFDSHLQSVFTQQSKVCTEKLLADVAEVQSGGTPLVSDKRFWGGDIAWYSSGELNKTFTQNPERHATQLKIDSSNAKLFAKGSLLAGMYDTAALKMSILDRPAAFNQAIAGIKPNDEIDLLFVMHAINAVKPRLLLERRGVRQKNLSLGKIKEISIPFPAVKEQQAVVSRLQLIGSETQRLESIYQQKLSALDALKKSLLHQTFSGQL